MLGDILTNKWVKFSVQIACTLTGLLMLYYQFQFQLWDMGSNILNPRIYAILCFMILAFGYAYPAHPNFLHMLYRFASTFLILTVGFFLLGGLLISNDASQGTNYVGGNYWVAFDALGTIADIGKASIMIAQAMIYIVPLCILVAVVISVFHADQTDEIQSVVIEGAIAFGFMALYGFLGGYFGWIP